MKHISDGIERLRENFVDQPRGITTGFNDLDLAIWGMQPRQLITVGGRPAMGKTGVMVDIALAASKEAPVGIFSLEMDADRLQARMASNLADLNYRNVRSGEVTDAEQDKFMDAAALLKDQQIYVDDGAGIMGIEPYWLKQRKLNIEKTMDHKIKMMVQQHGCKVIMVDYLQLITLTDSRMKDRRIIVGNITEALRDYAKRYDFTCVLLCQLRRFDQARYGNSKNKVAPTPTLDDLKESGEIENHSDIVVLLHRPEYYDEKRDLMLTEDIIEDNAQLMIRKNRDGPTGNIPVAWHAFSMSYRDLAGKSRDF